jgi:hypothetical protein
VCAAVALAPAVAQAGEQVSSNWAGNVAVPRHARGKLSSVSGTWVVPTATCSAGHEAYSAVWVGLGGYHEHAEGLEQLGTEQDCNDKGLASYAAWFEILPASPHAIHINVHPGDTVSASTTVAGHSVTFRMRDLTTGARYAATRHTATTDVSSADWILEAPSTCATSGRCTALPLANVGIVDFASATATAGRQTKPAGDAVWSNARDLQALPAMRMRGLEPPPGFPDTDLNRARLPIPPHPRARGGERRYRTLAARAARVQLRSRAERSHRVSARRALLASWQSIARRYRPGD